MKQTTDAPAPRCTDCKWVHEADSNKGTSFMGVELCAKHAAAPELLEALDQIEKIANQFTDPKTARVQIMNIARAAIAKVTG